MTIAITVLFLLAVLVLVYQRLPLLWFSLAFTAMVAAYTLSGIPAGAWKGVLWVVLAVLWLANFRPLRKALVSRPFMKAYLRLLPAMSDTEREALGAGSVWWDGQLFTGKPDWPQLLATPPARLSPEEQAFLDGPCETVCAMLNDFDVTHRRADLPPAVWDYLKRERFFAMIIPRRYGGLEFSTYAQSCVLVKLASRSITLSSTVAVPNSLGPAELLVHYGTDAQREHYLPRLARGEDIPCFALTSPTVGSDAASLSDTGIVCRGLHEGREVLGLRLNFSKRYITLAPVATVVGLAFRMFDPDHLLGDKADLGITCALLPRDTPGIRIGRRHFPLNIPFQNGPIQGVDVFVPLDAIIGGPAMAGRGWRMLIEQLSVGRCISLPASATGGAVVAAWATGAYARIRRQFGLSVNRFEGVEQVIARLFGTTYIMDAARSVTTAAIDAGHRPAVPAAILKYHLTEMGRQVANDAMDVHGGKGIMLGPRNYLARGWQSAPIGITVEGANILTRNLIIFGQGAIRCHPFVMREMEATRDADRRRGIDEFDRALFGHVGFAVSNAVRSLLMALTLARFEPAPGSGVERRFFQHIERFSASFAFATDVAMLSLGGALKRRENLSARLGDVLSALYLASMVLKRHQDNGAPREELPIVEWACRSLLYTAQEQLHGFLRNFPNRWLAALMRLLVFPRGRTYSAPADSLARQVAELACTDSPARRRLCRDLFQGGSIGGPMHQLQELLQRDDAAEALLRRLRVEGLRTGRVSALDLPGQVEQARAAGVFTDTEAEQLLDYDRRAMEIVHVDDFAPGELAHTDDQGASP
ncbi:MAG: acyl-CoA dehydrogenase [Pseudomonadota bacterium]